MFKFIILLTLPMLGYSQNIKSTKTDLSQANRTIVTKDKFISDSVALSLLKDFSLGDEVKFENNSEKNVDIIPQISKINTIEKQIQIYEIEYRANGKIISNPFVAKKIEPKVEVIVSQISNVVDLVDSKPIFIERVQRVNPIIRPAKKKTKLYKININLPKFKFRKKKSKFGCYKF